MSPQVLLQSSARSEAFPADRAAERLLSRVNPYVGLQIVLVIKSVPTLTTAKGFLTRFRLRVLLGLTFVELRLLAAALVSSEP